MVRLLARLRWRVARHPPQTIADHPPHDSGAVNPQPGQVKVQTDLPFWFGAGRRLVMFAIMVFPLVVGAPWWGRWLVMPSGG